MLAAYAAVLPVVGTAAADPSPEDMDAGLRKYITILRCLIMRTKTTEYARWSATAKVGSSDLIEAAGTMLQRLSDVRLSQLALLD